MLIVKFTIIILIGFVPILINLWLKKSVEVMPMAHENNHGTSMSIISHLVKKGQKVFLRLHHAMKYEKSVRKVYTMLLLFILMTIQIVDSYATVSAAQTIKDVAMEYGKNSVTTLETFCLYRRFLTHPLLFVLSGLMTCTLAIHSLADNLLLKIHYDGRWFFSLVLFTLSITIWCMCYSGRDIIIPELLTIILMAAQIYPKLLPTNKPGTRRPLTERTIERYWKFKRVA